ncbi:hypothetical protein V6Z11_A13G252800 [Gossypium hirsutum]
MSAATSLFTPFPPFSPLPKTTSKFSTTFRLRLPSPITTIRHRKHSPFPTFSTLPGGGNNSAGGGGNNDNGKGKGGSGGGDENAGDENRKEAMIVLAEAGRSMETLPTDLADAIQAGKVPGSVIDRFLGLEKSDLMRWLMQFDGFKERLLADDLFFAKVFIECGVGIFTKTAAEYERRRENFFKELEIVFADVPSLAASAGVISKFFHGCPDNAFQVALHGTSYSLLQRLGAVMRNGAKLFAVGTTSSLVGTAATNALINAKKAVDKSSVDEIENVPILSTSVAYGVYMAISSNLRYQVLAGVIEQRVLEPLLHQHKFLLSTICFAIRTGNTYLGSLLWVDYARLVGIQKPQEEENPVLVS